MKLKYNDIYRAEDFPPDFMSIPVRGRADEAVKRFLEDNDIEAECMSDYLCEFDFGDDAGIAEIVWLARMDIEEYGEFIYGH